MKRIFAGVALSVAAVSLTAAPAQAAAPKDPVATLKKQFVAGTGVTFTDRTALISGGQRAIFVRRTGTFAFSLAGLAASDITGKFTIKASDIPDGEDENTKFLKGMAMPERTIRIGKTAYISGGIFGQLLPEGKTWFKMPNGPTGGVTGLYGQIVNVTEAATLKTLIQNGKAVKGGYAGTITAGQLKKVSAWYRASMPFGTLKASQLKTPITFKLELDAAGLPKRLVTSYSPAALGQKAPSGDGVSVDTRFTGWGAKAKIVAPPADEVTTTFEDGSAELPESLPLGNGNDSVAK
ncbi:hypothetical protein [Nonomuraea typhae]|uniref:LppX_LprAFG lipoprotein n=1 Tax=Nonomuraea typhae TaxID=2603600 RepID=A0ABW7ZAW7_9ACTN